MLYGPSWVQFLTMVNTNQGLGIKVLWDILHQFCSQVNERAAAGREVVANTAGCLPGNLLPFLPLNS